MKRKQPSAEPVQAPVPIRETTYWVALTQTEMLALVDGVVLEGVRAKAGMIDLPNPVSGIEPYAVILP